MPTKIEDGFEMPSGGTPSIRPVAQCSSMTPTMILAVIAIVLFAGGLGFVGGMQVNKSSQSNAMQCNEWCAWRQFTSAAAGWF